MRKTKVICIVLAVLMFIQLFTSVACADSFIKDDYDDCVGLEKNGFYAVTVSKNLEDFYAGGTIYSEKYATLNCDLERNDFEQTFTFVAGKGDKQYRFNLELYLLDGGTLVSIPQKCDDLKMIQFKVDSKEHAVAVLESLSSGEIIKFEFCIDKVCSNAMTVIAKSNVESVRNYFEQKDKDVRTGFYADIISALNLGYNCSYPVNVDYVERSSSAISRQSFKSTDYCNGLYVNYDSQWSPFFTSLKQQGVATASGSVMNALMQSGWALYRGSDYFYVMQGVQSSSNERLISISTAAWSSARDSANATLTTSFQILDSVTLSLNTLTGNCEVVFMNAGVRLEDAISTIELVGGDTYMNYSSRSHSVEGSGNFYNILYAISSRLNIASQIWNALMPDPITTADTVYYGTSINQDRCYGGPVRAVANRTSSNTYLWSEGTNLGIIAVYVSSETFVSYRTAFAFTACSLL